MNADEKQLILDLQHRLALYEDMKAYKQLYELLYQRLFIFSFSFVKSREAAEEIVSDVFIKLWSIKRDLGSINNLSVYLYTITKNFSLNYITKHSKLRVISLEDIDSTHYFTFNTPEDSLISREIIRKINDSIKQLPVQCRITFYLVKECNLKYKEVAAVLNISVNTVRNQVAIATKKIAEALPAQIKTSFFSISHFSES